jgi:hypothetical protein
MQSITTSLVSEYFNFLQVSPQFHKRKFTYDGLLQQQTQSEGAKGSNVVKPASVVGNNAFVCHPEVGS